MTNNKNIERYIETLKDLPQIKHAKHLKSVTSSVTTNWGAEAWSPLQISLDCYQNFRDSCVSAKIDISNVKTEIKIPIGKNKNCNFGKNKFSELLKL